MMMIVMMGTRPMMKEDRINTMLYRNPRVTEDEYEVADDNETRGSWGGGETRVEVRQGFSINSRSSRLTISLINNTQQGTRQPTGPPVPPPSQRPPPPKHTHSIIKRPTSQQQYTKTSINKNGWNIHSPNLIFMRHMELKNKYRHIREHWRHAITAHATKRTTS